MKKSHELQISVSGVSKTILSIRLHIVYGTTNKLT